MHGSRKGTKLFKSVVDNLVQLVRVTLKEADSIYAEYKRIPEMVVIKNHQLFLNFDKRKTDVMNSFSLMSKA